MPHVGCAQSAHQKPGKHQPFQDEDPRGEQQHPQSNAVVAGQEGKEAEGHSLNRGESNARREPACPEQGEVNQRHGHQDEVEDRRHPSRPPYLRINATVASTTAPTRNTGTRIMRNRASVDSTTPSRTATAAIAASDSSRSASLSPVRVGSKRPTISEPSNQSFNAAP